MERNYWLLGVKNSVKRLRKSRMQVSLRSAGGGERGGVGLPQTINSGFSITANARLALADDW
jgi:hypothetical protein